MAAAGTLAAIEEETRTALRLVAMEEWAGSFLGPNLHLLSDVQVELARMLVEEKQSHLFSGWPGPGVSDSEKIRFFSQVEKLNANYPGGLVSYIRNARRLLAGSKAGQNPFEGYVPSVPTGERLVYGDEKFVRYEEAGIVEMRSSAFVLVAGGLGERLGYGGVKVALPAEVTTGTCFLHLYSQNILAMQDASNKKLEGVDPKKIPFVIMTSDDTHSLTLQLLEGNNYFGLDPGQVHLLKQEKVVCFGDTEATISLDPNDPYLIQTKPHGHGDVHAVLYSSGLLPKWQSNGCKWILFFQDTNGLLFKAIPASLGVSSVLDLDVNSLCVPRKAKEPIGGITRLTSISGAQMVINVEYNQLDPLLRATGHVDGDVNDETGFSPFPGNINQLVFKLGPYCQELSKTRGAIVEFVNPKYKDASKTSFKSSTRLECMMQDYPKTLSPDARVGFSVLDAWLAYAPVKNNPEDAVKVPQGNPRHSATSGEMAMYKANSLILRKAGVEVDGPKMETFNGQEVELWPRIVWSPLWALTYSDLKKKITGSCSISQSSTLVLEGQDILIENLSVNGALVVRACQGALVKISNLDVRNEGWKFESVSFNDKAFSEELRIRGFNIVKLGQRVLSFDEPGEYMVHN